MSGPGAFLGSSLHKSLLIPAVVILMQSIGSYGLLDPGPGIRYCRSLGGIVIKKGQQVTTDCVYL